MWTISKIVRSEDQSWVAFNEGVQAMNLVSQKEESYFY